MRIPVNKEGQRQSRQLVEGGTLCQALQKGCVPISWLAGLGWEWGVTCTRLLYCTLVGIVMGSAGSRTGSNFGDVEFVNSPFLTRTSVLLFSFTAFFRTYANSSLASLPTPTHFSIQPPVTWNTSFIMSVFCLNLSALQAKLSKPLTCQSGPCLHSLVLLIFPVLHSTPSLLQSFDLAVR